ncbi:MAG: arginine--tRNA ligase [Nitrospiraceae bacterium]|nr:arginine--tRNA ligase [Nitrospiraceae bacterium]
MVEIVTDTINGALRALGIEPPERIEVEVPKDESLGDLSTPVAMSLAKVLKQPPRKIAADILSKIDEARKNSYFESIEIAGPGFINFRLKGEFISKALWEVLSNGGKNLRKNIGRGARVQVEFVSANPTGPLHLGHGRGAAVGSALSNLLKAAGFDVTREFYINDAGRQVALLGLSVFARYQELLGVECPFPEDGYRGDYIADIAKEIISQAGDKYKGAGFDSAGEFFKGFSRDMMLRQIEADLAAFGVHFDIWQSEKELYGRGEVENTIQYLRAKGHIYEKDKALWFRATAFGDEKDRVIVKSDGQYTYFASDIAYHKKKVDGGYAELINLWGADHHGYIQRVKAAIEALGYDRERLKVILVQMVNLLRGGKPVQMSKRAGEFVTLREVMEEVGADTTKFIFLTRRSDSHLDFDLEVAKESSAENPVFYVQYANARINSIFRHAAEKGMGMESIGGISPSVLGLLKEPEEVRIMKKLLMYPMVFEASALAREPHRITYYLQEIAGMFHPYYNRHRIVSETGPELTLARLALVEAVRLVLRDGLEILGVTAPERM